MHIITGRDSEVAAWCSNKIGQVICPPYVAIGFSKTGEALDGAAVFNGWNLANIEVTIYGPGCLTRPALRFGFHYAFEQMKAIRLTVRTKRNNKRMRKLLPRIGFTFENVSRNFFGPSRGEDALVYVIFKDQALKWIK